MASRSRQHLQIDFGTAPRRINATAACRAGRRYRQALARVAGGAQACVLAALVDRIEVGLDQIDIRLRPPRLGVLLDAAAAPSQGVKDDETEILSVPVRLRRAGREIRMVIDGTD